ncbi:nucleotidyltransferase family protein [Lewinella cohaerens]|uniref:nucleotidyltransferase family protein n=1 Tax=Lewinella cohaerens TaxID=70995 RepID=UPI000370EE67|nr:nucleotidyltransferase family protein [Lewinella cohaerens]
MNTIWKKDTGIILLAAGEAKRMGMPKQLLVHEKEPLIRHIAKLLLRLKRPVTVVLGARAEVIKAVISDLPLKIVVNPAWQKGMGTSLVAGLNSFSSMDGVLFCVVDQPYLSEALLHLFLETFDKLEVDSVGILAARYDNGQLGVPALFSCQWFEELKKVAPGEGARKIIKQEKGNLVAIDFPEGIFDLDRPEDWERFREK